MSGVKIFFQKIKWKVSFSVTGFLFFILVLGFSFQLQEDNSTTGDNAVNFGIFGPDNVCLLRGNTIEQFSAGGNPNTDLYIWQVIEPDGQIRNFQGGSGFQILSFTFSKSGEHLIKLTVRRGSSRTIFEEEKVVSVVKGPTILLKEAYILCQGQSIDLQVLDPNSPNVEKYIFEWTNEEGEKLEGVGNKLTIDREGVFKVRYFFRNADGQSECENLLQTTVKFNADFELVSNGTEFCPEGVLEIQPSIPIKGAWYIQKEGSPRVYLKDSDKLALGMNELIEVGEYTVIFEIPNASNPTCLVKKEFTFVYNFPPAFEVEVIKNASDCSASDGILQIRALTEVQSLFYVINENTNSQAINLQQGETFEWENLSSGIYTFEGILKGCKFSLATFVPLGAIPESLKFEIDPEKIVPETCSEFGINSGSFTITFNIPPQQLIYELYNQRGGLVLKGELDDSEKLDWEIAVGGGKYFLEIFPKPDELEDSSCKVPSRVEIDVPGLPQVNFSIPLQFSFCESYELIPSYDQRQRLEFSLQFLDDMSVPIESGTAFTIRRAGKYALVGRDLDKPTEVCPRKVEIIVDKVEPAIFEPTFVEQDCQGNMIWEVNIQNYLPNRVSIKWFGPNGSIVSTGPRMFPVEYGNYRLEVQPSGILGNCPDNFKEFTVLPPVLSTSVNLISTPLCPFSPDALISLNADFDNIGKISWRYFDANGAIEELSTGMEVEIIGSKPGTYVVIVFSNRNINCELGRESIEVLESTDLTNFEVPSTEFIICESYEWTPDTIFDLTFLLQYPDGTTIEKTTGQSFVLNQRGEYILRGEPNNPTEPYCPIEKKFEVELIERIEFTPEFVLMECNGNFIYEASIGDFTSDSALFIWRNALGEVVGNQQQFQTSIPGQYSLEVQPKGSKPCNVEVAEFTIRPPVLSFPINLVTDEWCPNKATHKMKINEVIPSNFKIRWYKLNVNGEESELSAFEDMSEIELNEVGNYKAVVFGEINLTCRIGEATKDLAYSVDFVDYEVPVSLFRFCRQFLWEPITRQNLKFQLLFPDGTVQEKQSGEGFILDQSGIYTVWATPSDPFIPTCPLQKSFEVEVVSSIDFDVEFIQRDCDGMFTYFAEIGNVSPNEALFFWRNTAGVLLSNEQYFRTNQPGKYSLEVQPRNSLPCIVDNKFFDIEPPILSIPVVIPQKILCPEDVFTSLTILAPLLPEFEIKWFFTAINGEKKFLSEFKDTVVIDVSLEGFYEVEVRDIKGCLLGSDRMLLLRSTDTIRPIVKEKYQICPEYAIGETINPGAFSSYAWVLDGRVISNSAIFKPQMPGDWILTVLSNEGCEYSVQFVVEEQCELKIMLPNAFIPGDTNRSFLIYTNYLVDELEVFVFNKWGQQVFHCAEKNLISESSTCSWDGYFNNKRLEIGSYAVKVIYKNTGENIQKYLNTTITVIR